MHRLALWPSSYGVATGILILHFHRRSLRYKLVFNRLKCIAWGYTKVQMDVHVLRGFRATGKLGSGEVLDTLQDQVLLCFTRVYECVCGAGNEALYYI